MGVKNPPSALGARLLDHSEQVFSGDLARLEDVAAAVGVSRATLYYYFAGHDDLRAFLITEHARRGAAAIEAANDPQQPARVRLLRMVTAMVGYLGERPGFCTAVVGSIGASGELASALRLNDAEIGEPLRALLRTGGESGEFAVADVRAAADVILGGVLFSVIGRSSQPGSAVDDQFATATAEQLVAGVVATPGR